MLRLLSAFLLLSPINAFIQYSLTPNAIEAHFSEYTLKHNKQYSEEEYLYRKAVFSENLKLINSHNQKFSEGQATFWLGPTQFADLTNGEYRRHVLGGLKPSIKTELSKNLIPFKSTVDVEELPREVDWRKKNVVHPPKNQGQCGSCWSFSAVAAIESAWAQKTGDLFDLSEQELVDCVRGGNDTCTTGGEMTDAFDYVIQAGGIETEKEYPYTATSGNTCSFEKKKSVVTISSYVNVTTGDEPALKEAVSEHASVAVGIDASQFTFQLYFGGVYSDDSCKNDEESLDHGVSVVGYGTDQMSSEDYWIVKNSWGENWGQHGYILMARGKSNMCGIATAASYPVV